MGNSIKKGDRVQIVRAYEAKKYEGQIFEVLSDPYALCGTLVVKMKCHETGKYFHGGFAVEFLEEVINKMYGLKCNGVLLNTYENPIQAYEDAKFAYEETGVFHEVVKVSY